MQETFNASLKKDIQDFRGFIDDAVGFFKRILATRLALYTLDLILIKFPGTIRNQQLSKEHLVCRFPIPLIGSWK